MPRPPRIHFPGAIFHAMSRGVGAQSIFLDDADRSAFLKILLDIKACNPFKVYAYCLMSNHFHLLLEVERFSISLIMHHLLARYSTRFNVRYRRSGHVLQGRYKAILCQKDSYILELLRYIHLNPVKANLVKKPEDWPWSGHHEYIGTRSCDLVDAAYPLSFFHSDPSRARALYEQFVTLGLADSETANRRLPHDLPTPGDIARQKSPMTHSSELVPANPAIGRAGLEEIGRKAEAQSGVALEMIRGASRLRLVTASRRLFIRLALSQGIATSEIAAFLGCSCSAVCKTMRHREQVR